MQQYDVVIIGGGIHGAAAAQAASARGYDVVVLEQYETLACGTSSRSSKLIHGGLRYLESLSIGLVRECLQERALLLKNAPDLVQLRPFHLPIYSHSRRSRLAIGAGLTLYRLLGGGPFSTVDQGEWDQLDGLETRELQAVYCYYDAQTDDRLLTRAVMNSATGLGAELKLGAEASEIALHKNGCEITYELGGNKTTLRGTVLINAAGPWVNEILNRVTPRQSVTPVDLVQGTHIIVPDRMSQRCYYVEAQDGRPVFVLPWKNSQCLIGTTETLHTGRPEDTRPLKHEIEYLLAARSQFFPKAPAVDIDAVQAFSGLRVLPKVEKDPNARNRETIFLTDRDKNPRMLSILGGKLTAHRATAEKAMRILASTLPDRSPRGDTRTLRLSAD